MTNLYPTKGVTRVCVALLFIIISVIVFSCRKELKIVPLSATDSVDAARSWYEKSFPVNNALGVANNLTTLAVNSNSNSGDFDFSQYIKPDWKHNARYKRFGKDVIEMPVDPSRVLSYGLKKKSTGRFTSPKENSRAWFLLLNDGKQYDAYIMVLIGDPGYINGDPSRMAKNSYRKRDDNFSGMLMYFTPKGKFIRAYKYKNGQQVTPNQAASASQTQSTGKKTNQEAFVDCEDWVDVIYDTSTGQIVWVGDTYTVCTERQSQGGDGPGNDDTGAPSNPPPCTVGNSVTQRTVNHLAPGDGDGGDDGGETDPNQGYPAPPTSTGQTCSVLRVTDSLQNYPCAHNLIASIPGLTDTVANIINKTFGNSDQFNLIFRANPNLDPKVDGQINDDLGDWGVSFDANQNMFLRGTFVIDLNPTVLTHATKEYILATIYHEALHAYITVLQRELGNSFNAKYPSIVQYQTTDANGNPITETVLKQHSIMAGSFLTPLANAIQTLNPSFTPEYAMALAQGGIVDDSRNFAINDAERRNTTNALGTKCN